MRLTAVGEMYALNKTLINSLLLQSFHIKTAAYVMCTERDPTHTTHHSKKRGTPKQFSFLSSIISPINRFSVDEVEMLE